MEKNKLLEIQEMLLKEMKRLDNDILMEREGKEEVARSNALSQSAGTFLKAINVSLRIMEQAERCSKTSFSLQAELGLNNFDEK